MKKYLKTDLAFLIFLLFYTSLFVSGISGVPFHPDEATQIHNSRELMTYLTEPRSLAWDGELPVTEDLRFRMIDAPMPRYTIGLIRLFTNHEPPSAHWDWGKSFQENTAAGALPSGDILKGSRLLIAVSIPLAMGFLYLTGRNLSGRLSGWTAAVLLGINPLVLLHGRRAMAEGLLILMISAFLWVSSRHPLNAWFLGAAAALALNTKQSALILIPLGIVGLAWNPIKQGSWKKIFGRLAIFLSVILLLTVLLNPVLWEHPRRTLQVSWELRSSLSFQQTYDYYQGPPPNLLKRILILIMNLYTTPPRIADIGNYLDAIQGAQTRYLSHIMHRAFRGLIPGSIMLALTAGGFYQLGQTYRNGKSNKVSAAVVLLGVVVQAAALVIMIPLPWQRYVIPLIPFLSIILAAGLAPFLTRIMISISYFQNEHQ